MRNPNFCVKPLYVLSENANSNANNTFEGDMILTPEQRYRAEHGMDVDGSDLKRGSGKFRLWPRGELVYKIHPTLGKFVITRLRFLCYIPENGSSVNKPAIKQHLSIYPSIHPSIHSSIHPSIHPSTHPFIYKSIIH